MTDLDKIGVLYRMNTYPFMGKLRHKMCFSDEIIDVICASIIKNRPQPYRSNTPYRYASVVGKHTKTAEEAAEAIKNSEEDKTAIKSICDRMQKFFESEAL